MSRSTRHPSAATVLSIIALVLAASGTAMAAGNLVNGDSLIKKHSLSGNRLRNHTITSAQINFKQFGTVPTVAGFMNSGLVTLTSSTTPPGTQQTLMTRGPFSFVAQCLKSGSGFITANVLVKDNNATGAIEEDDYSANNRPPATLNPGDTHPVFYQVMDVVPHWYGDYYNLFSVAAPHGPALSGMGSIGVNVLGADCAYQLLLFG
jgi:hypothetical protein